MPRPALTQTLPADNEDAITTVPSPPRWTYRLLCLFALVDGAAILALWGAALWRSAQGARSLAQALHLGTELLLCTSTLAAVAGLLRGARFAVPLACAVLGALLYLSFSGTSPTRDPLVLLLLGGSLLYSRRIPPDTSTS